MQAKCLRYLRGTTLHERVMTRWSRHVVQPARNLCPLSLCNPKGSLHGDPRQERGNLSPFRPQGPRAGFSPGLPGNQSARVSAAGNEAKAVCVDTGERSIPATRRQNRQPPDRWATERGGGSRPPGRAAQKERWIRTLWQMYSWSCQMTIHRFSKSVAADTVTTGQITPLSLYRYRNVT
jgi:hypothetical protein